MFDVSVAYVHSSTQNGLPEFLFLKTSKALKTKSCLCVIWFRSYILIEFGRDQDSQDEYQLRICREKRGLRRRGNDEHRVVASEVSWWDAKAEPEHEVDNLNLSKSVISFWSPRDCRSFHVNRFKIAAQGSAVFASSYGSLFFPTDELCPAFPSFSTYDRSRINDQLRQVQSGLTFSLHIRSNR